MRFGGSSTFSAAFAGKLSTNDAMPAVFVSSHHPIPRQPGSRDDLGPFLNVVTWILLITSALAVFTRLITKRALRRTRVDIDDGFVVLALVRMIQYAVAYHRLTICAQITSIGSGASVSIQVTNGLGREYLTLAEKEIEAYLQVRLVSPLVLGHVADHWFRPSMQTRSCILRRWL